MKKHILVIAQYFYPEQFRINDICSEWVERGYKVTVLTGIPNYPEGKYYKGYSLFKRRKDIYNGVDIIRIPLVPRGHNSLMLVLNYLSFVMSGFFWKLLTHVKADLVFIFEVSPMTQALPGVWYAKRRKIPCYLYVQDLWPENVAIITGTTNKVIINSIGKMVDYIYKNCAKIFVTSKSFATAIEKRGVEPSKVEYIPQYAEAFYQPLEKEVIDSDVNNPPYQIVFTGNIGRAQGLEILPETALKLKELKMSRTILFNIVGNGRYKDDFKKIVQEYEIKEMFNFIDKVPATQVPKIIAQNDAAFLCLTDSPLFELTIPAKLQSYLACGIPIIASVKGETAKIINESGAGYVSDTGDVEQLVHNIVSMIKLSSIEYKEMGIKAKEYSNLNFNKEELLDKIELNF